MRAAVKTAVADADKQVDFTQVIQGHCGQTVQQVFTVDRTRVRHHKAADIAALEHIVKDQFGNLYVVFTARLMDAEVYAVTAWVGTERWDGAQKRLILVKEWKQFSGFNDDMLGALQTLAFTSLAKAQLAIIKARHASKLPKVPSNVVASGNN